MRKRGFSLGLGRDGLIPVRGNLLPEVAAQFQRISDSLLNPKLDGLRFTATDPGGTDTGDQPDRGEDADDMRTDDT